MSETQRYVITANGRFEALEDHARLIAGDRVVVMAEDHDALQSRLDAAEREAKNDAIAYRAALEKQDELRQQLAERDAALRSCARASSAAEVGLIVDAALLSSAEQARNKCDGNHGGGQCQDPECFNDDGFKNA
jgi:hypothetical protein